MNRARFTPAQDMLIVATADVKGAGVELARLLGVPAEAIYNRRHHLATYKPTQGKRGRKLALLGKEAVVKAMAAEPTMSKTAACKALGVGPQALTNFLAAHSISWDNSQVKLGRPVK